VAEKAEQPKAHRGGRQVREEHDVEFSRIVSFSDGVFAIAITLLVLNLDIPVHLGGATLGDVLSDQSDDFFAYAISFAVIGRFWIVHHRFFSEVTAFDSGLLALNLFYLAWIVLIPFSSRLLGDHGGHTVTVVIYALNIAGTTLVSAGMSYYAQRSGLMRPGTDQDSGTAFRFALGTAAVFLLSIPVAFVNPRIAPFIWLLLFVSFFFRRRTREPAET
jgi:uncharacterized membrane protein